MLNAKNSKFLLSSFIDKMPPLVGEATKIILDELDTVEKNFADAKIKIDDLQKKFDFVADELKIFGVDETILDAKKFLKSMPSLPMIYTDDEKILIEKLNAALNTLKSNLIVWFNTDNLPHEIWRDVIGYEGCYKVSNFGRVKSFSGGEEKILHSKNTNSRRHYPNVTLFKGTHNKFFNVHILVAKAFITNPENKPLVHHINGERNNSYVWNLQWVTHQENNQYAHATGKAKSGSAHPQSKLTDEQVAFIRSVYKSHDKNFGAKALAKLFDVDFGLISRVAKGKNYKNVK